MWHGCVDHGTSAASLNHAITGLKFFFTVTLDRSELMVRMQPMSVPRILPVVLSPDEVRRLIEAAGNLKHQTALSVAYGTGLRVSGTRQCHDPMSVSSPPLPDLPATP